MKDVRKVMEAARDDRDLYRRQTVLFLDEIHRFTKAQQDALLPGVENRWVVLVAATTENPNFSVVTPLLSRSLLLTLQPLTIADVEGLLRKAVEDPRGLAGEVTIDDDALAHLVRVADGDARRALTALEAAAGTALDDSAAGTARITLVHAERALDRAAVRYDRQGDQHYDVASALIKSMRGSDVDAALHYLARMIEAGEDPRFIARRIVIAASEDVGMADPSALQTAVAAMHAVAQIGMPEARIVLAQAVVHNATAPKSNASYLGINAAIADVRAGLGGSVPRTCATRTTPARRSSATARATSTPTTSPPGSRSSSTPPTNSSARTTTSPPTGVSRTRSASASPGCAGSCGVAEPVRSPRARSPFRPHPPPRDRRSRGAARARTPDRRAPADTHLRRRRS